jgi:Ca-activated chloride channel homolog
MDNVDLALIVALDGSASVTFDEFNLMANGCGAAFRDPQVAAGLVGGPRGASLCSLVLWSGPGHQEVMTDWTRISNAKELEDFASSVENVPRVVIPGSTALGEALAVCERLFTLKPAAAARAVLDMVGDGRSNDGIRPEPVRDRLIAAGVTINGLCVLHEEPDLVQSYTNEVIGGPGAFVLQCQNYTDFADAMRQKLAKEVA